MKPPICVDLTATDVSAGRELGILTDALLAAQAERVLISFGANDRNVQVTSAFARWMQRHERLIRTRVNALALVIPSMWWSIELQATTPVAEWGGQPVRMAQEEDAIIDADGRVRWALRRQDRLFLVR